MSILTEEGYVVFETIDEIGRVVVDGILEDGTMIFVIPVTYKYHLPMIRLEMKPKAWSILKRIGERIAIRRPHKPFQPERPIQATVT